MMIIIIARRHSMGKHEGKVAVVTASDESSYVAGIELFVDGGFAQV
jgi:hypothetical protein